MTTGASEKAGDAERGKRESVALHGEGRSCGGSGAACAADAAEAGVAAFAIPLRGDLRRTERRGGVVAGAGRRKEGRPTRVEAVTRDDTTKDEAGLIAGASRRDGKTVGVTLPVSEEVSTGADTASGDMRDTDLALLFAADEDKDKDLPLYFFLSGETPVDLSPSTSMRPERSGWTSSSSSHAPEKSESGDVESVPLLLLFGEEEC